MSADTTDTARTAAATTDGLISVAAHIEAELDEALAAHRLSRPSYLVLGALARAGGEGVGQRELITAMRRTAGTVSVRLGRLERAGMIERRADPEDRRSVTVTITEAGRALHEAAEPAYLRRAERLLAGLPEDAAERIGGDVAAWLRFLEPGEGSTPRLGVAVASAATATRMRRAVGLPDVPGVLVLRVMRNTPASRAGLQRGDLITAAGGQEVRTIADVDRAVRGGGGSAVKLGLVRGADELALAVELG